jgi:YaiO family outer membrane protein
MRKMLKVALAFLVLAFWSATLVPAQGTSELFGLAKTLANDKAYYQSQQLLLDILSKEDNGDVRFYLGLVYSWNGQYKEAREEFRTLAKDRPASMELLNARYNVESWSGNYAAAIDLLDWGIEQHPNELDLQIKKAKMLSALNRNGEAATLLEEVLSKDPSLFEARDMLMLVKRSKLQNTISVNGAADIFSDNTDTWYSSYLQYSRRVSVGTVIGRLNYANMFSTNGYQLEADGYLSLWRGGYSYANVGFSPSPIFPDFRCGYEYYHSLPRGFEASLGFRYLRFAPLDIVLYTGSIGKYYGSYWFSLRPHLRFKQGDASYSLRGSARRYFNDPDTYLGLEASYGTAPDFDHQNIYYSYLKRLKSYGGRATYSQRFGKVWIGIARLGVSRDEVVKGMYRTQTSVDFTVSRAF